MERILEVRRVGISWMDAFKLGSSFEETRKKIEKG